MPLDHLSPDVRNFIRDIEETIEKKRNALERKGKSHEDMVFIQGEIKAYRDIINRLTPKGDDDE